MRVYGAAIAFANPWLGRGVRVIKFVWPEYSTVPQE